MKKCTWILLTGWLAGGALMAAAGPATNDLTARLQQGLFEEEASQDLPTAIADYLALARQYDQDRKVAATAVYRLGECYRKLGQTNEAVTAYQRLLRDFPDQTRLATLSRQNLDGLGVRSEAVAGAGPAPAVEAAKPAPTDEEDKEIRRIQELVRNSPDLINAASDGGNPTPLIRAAYNGWLRVAAYLLEHGADVNTPVASVAWNKELSAAGRVTPLMVATLTGNRAMVQFLLDHGAALEDRDGSGETALFLAVRQGFVAVTETLLAAHADVNAAETSGATPLFAAVAAANPKLITTLVAAGADVNHADVNGRTILSRAIGTTPGLLQAVLATGVNPNATDHSGLTPLSYAVERDTADAVKLLLAAKANPDLGTKDIPLLAAINYKKADAFAALLAGGANPNLCREVDWPLYSPFGPHNYPDHGRVTPLYLAVSTKQLAAVRSLLQAHADPNDTQTTPEPLALGAMSEPEILAALLDAGARADATENPASSRTLLVHAILLNNVTNVELLLKHGADVNRADADGNTPLIVATSQNAAAPIIELLLDRGADPNARSHTDWTPLHFAAQNSRNPRLFQLLLAHHADPNVRNSDNRTPLDILKGELPPGSTFQQRLAAITARAGQPPRPIGTLADAKYDSAPTDAPSLVEILRAYGALDRLPEWNQIQVARAADNFSKAIFTRDTNDWNHFTLLELLAVQYQILPNEPRQTGFGFGRGPVMPGVSFGRFRRMMIGKEQLGYPDLAHLRIRRPAADGKSWQDLPVDARAMLESTNAAADVPLRWGDVVEIPEEVHPLDQPWQGFSTTVENGLEHAVARRVVFQVQGGGTNTFGISQEGSAGGMGSCWFYPALSRIGQLLSSSDQAHITVTRGTNVWTLDCSDPNHIPEFWLRDGDVVYVPQR